MPSWSTSKRPSGYPKMLKLIILCTLVVQAISKPSGCVELCDGEQTSTNHGSYKSYNIQSAYSKELERFSSGGRTARLEDLGVRNPIESDRPGNWSEVDSYATDNGRGRVYSEHGQIVNGPKTVRYYSKNYTSSWGSGGAIPESAAAHIAQNSHYFEEEFQKLRNEIRHFQDNFRSGRVTQRNSDSFNEDFNNQVETIRGHLDNFCKETNTQDGRLHSNGMNMSEEFERHVQRMREDMDRWINQFRHHSVPVGTNQAVTSPGHNVHTSSSGYVKEEQHHYTTHNGVPVQTQVPNQDYRTSGRQRETVDRTPNYNHASGGFVTTSSQEQHYRQSSTGGRRDHQYTSPVYDENRVVTDTQQRERQTQDSRRREPQYTSPAYDQQRVSENQQRERQTQDSRRREHQYGTSGYDARIEQQVRGHQKFEYTERNQGHVAPEYDSSTSHTNDQTVERQTDSRRQGYYGSSIGRRPEQGDQTQQREENYGQRTYQRHNSGYQTATQPGHSAGYETQWSSSSQRRDQTNPQFVEQQVQHHQGAYQPGRVSTYTEETNESQIKKAVTTQENHLVHGVIQLPDQWGKDGSRIQTMQTVDCDTAEGLAKQEGYRRHKRSAPYDESIDLNADLHVRNFEGLDQQREASGTQSFGNTHNANFEQAPTRQFEFGRHPEHNAGLSQYQHLPQHQAGTFQHNQHRDRMTDELASRTLDSMLEQQSEYLSKLRQQQETGYNTRYGHFDQQQTDYYGNPQNHGMSGMSGNSHAQWQLNGSPENLENVHHIVSGPIEQQQESLDWQVERVPQRNTHFSKQHIPNHNIWTIENQSGSPNSNQEETTVSANPSRKPAPKPTPRYSTPWQNSGYTYSSQTENIDNIHKQTTDRNRDTMLLNLPDIEIDINKESRDFRTDHSIVSHRESTTPHSNTRNGQSWQRHSVPIEEDFTHQIQQSGDLTINDEFSQSQRARNDWFNGQVSNAHNQSHSRSNNSQIGNERLAPESQYRAGQQVLTDQSHSIGNVNFAEHEDLQPILSFQPRILEAYGGRGTYDPNHGDEVFDRVKVNPTATLPPNYEGDPWYIQVKPEESRLEERVISLEERPKPTWVEATVQTTTESPTIWNRLGHKITTTYEKAKEKAKDIFG